MAIQGDGHSTLINIGAITTLKEKTITPPGVDGGGSNNVTTMHNTEWRSFASKKLKTLTPVSGTYAYDPKAITDIVALINVNASMVVTFPDLSTITFWGWVNSFIPNESTEGEQPTADVEIIPSNLNGSGVETAPVYAAPPPLMAEPGGFDDGGLEMTAEEKEELRQYEEDEKRLQKMKDDRLEAIRNHALKVQLARRRKEIEWKEKQLEVLRKHAESLDVEDADRQDEAEPHRTVARREATTPKTAPAGEKPSQRTTERKKDDE